MQYKWLPTAPGVCSRCVCVCVCSLFTAVCVCTLDGLNAEHKFRVCHVTFTFSSTIHSKKETIKKKNESVLILIRIFIIVSLLKYSKYTVWTWTLHRAYFHVNKNVIIKLKYIVPKSEIKTVLYLNVKKLYLKIKWKCIILT